MGAPSPRTSGGAPQLGESEPPNPGSVWGVWEPPAGSSGEREPPNPASLWGVGPPNPATPTQAGQIRGWEPQNWGAEEVGAPKPGGPPGGSRSPGGPGEGSPRPGEGSPRGLPGKGFACRSIFASGHLPPAGGGCHSPRLAAADCGMRHENKDRRRAAASGRPPGGPRLGFPGGLLARVQKPYPRRLGVGAPQMKVGGLMGVGAPKPGGLPGSFPGAFWPGCKNLIPGGWGLEPPRAKRDGGGSPQTRGG